MDEKETAGELSQERLRRSQSGWVPIDADQLCLRSRGEDLGSVTAAPKGCVDKDSPVFQRREDEPDDLLRKYRSVSQLQIASTALAPQRPCGDGNHPHHAADR